jgi:hypothetical protein
MTECQFTLHTNVSVRFLKYTFMSFNQNSVCMHLPHPVTVEVAEAELPTDGCGPQGSACGPPVDLCAGAATWLQLTCHNQGVLDHQADEKTLQALNLVSAWLVSAHTLPGGTHFPPPIHCKIRFAIVLYKTKCKKSLLHKFHG